MQKLYNFYYFSIVLLLGFTSIESLAQSSSPSNYFRSAKSGMWHAADTWESSTDGLSNWLPCAAAPASEANTITISSGHSVTISNNITLDQVVVSGGGILDLVLDASSVLTINDGTGSDITVLNGGTFRHNIAGNSLPSFAASATLEIQDGGILEAANNNGIPGNYANISSVTAPHVIWNNGSIFNWNNSANPEEGVTYFPETSAVPVFRFSKPVTIGGSVATVINGLTEANANVSFQGNGSKFFRNGITGTGKVGVTAINGGQFIINGTTATLGGSGILELNDNGLFINAGTAVTLTSDKIINNYSNGTVTIAGTLTTGDFVISGNSKVKIDGIVRTSNAIGLSGGSRTTFATASGFTVSSIGPASLIDYNRTGNQTVSPISYNNLTISGSGSKTAAAGSDISVMGTLNITAGNTFALNGTNHLKLNNGGTLNVNTNSIFDNGGESQVSGGSSPTINIYGTFITRDAQGFSGTNTSIPGATATPPTTIALNIYPGSTVEYGRLGDQVVSGRNDYKNLTFSGSGTKMVSKCRPIGTVTIKDNAIADVSNKTFGDTTATNLVMTGGRLKIGGTGTKPEMGGTYILTGGVIEFTNNGLTKETINTLPTYLNIEVSGTGVANSKGNTFLADGGSCTVKTGGIFENSGYRLDGLMGIQTFVMEAGSIFKTGVSGGVSGNDTAALRNFETLLIDARSTIIYSRSGNQTITPVGSAHPSLALKGSGNKTVSGGLLLIAANADSVVIDTLAVLKVSAGAKVDFNNRKVIIHSSAGGTGMIGEISDGPAALLNATDVTVERFIPAKRSFRFLSSPVTTISSINANWMEGAVNSNIFTKINPYPGYGTNITGSGATANGFDPTKTNNPSLFTFNVLSQKWDAVPNTKSTLSAGSPYSIMVRGDRNVDLTIENPAPSATILRSKGSLFTGTFSPEVSPIQGRYSFIGNPYACSVNWNALIKHDISATYYTWDPNLNVRGAYATYNGFDKLTAPTGSKIDHNIQPGQAFFIRTSKTDPQSTDPISANLTFKENSKTNIVKAVFKPVSSLPNLSIQLLLNMGGGSQNTADAAVVFFDKEFTAAIGDEDSYKFTNPDENMAIDRAGTSLSIEGRSAITDMDTVALKIWQLEQENYFLKLTGKNFTSPVTALIQDAYLHIQTPVDISTETILPFTIDSAVAASYASDRFSILFTASGTLPVTLTGVKAYTKEDGIQVDWTAQTEINIDRYEIEKSADGQDFVFQSGITAKGNNAGTEMYNWFDAVANEGNNFYRIKIIEKSGAVKYSEIINVKVDKQKADITIFPNPIKTNMVNLQFSNIEKANYPITIYNNLGQKVYMSMIKHTTSSAAHRITLGKTIPKGVYRLTISKKGKNITKTLVFD